MYIETNKNIDSSRKIGGDYFFLQKRKSSTLNLQFYLNQFNHEDYYIYKSTGRFKEVSYEDLLEFKNGGYIFFKKDLYDNEVIDSWINWLYSNRLNRFSYLNIPFPPFNPEDKIKIKK